MNQGQQWTKAPERGSSSLLRFMLWMATSIGRGTTRLLLGPITVYFLLFAPTAVAASRDYLARILDRKPGWRDVYRHIHCFASVILDRVFFLTGRFDQFEIQTHNVSVLTQHREQGRGCIMLGSHIGSFEALRCLGAGDADLPLKILMYTDNAERMNQLLSAINPGMASQIISLGSQHAMLEVKEWLDQGGIIGMLGDRITHGGKLTPVTLLGDEVYLPQGPMILAAVTGVPVIMCAALYRGGKRYDLYFDELCDRFQPSRAERGTAIAPLLQQYAATMENWCRLAPYNWFNFFPYWHSKP